MRFTRTAGVLCAGFLTMLVGCSSGSSPASSPIVDTETPPAGDGTSTGKIEGIAPPSGVSVVTANNAD